jgi:hypothetical protein
MGLNGHVRLRDFNRSAHQSRPYAVQLHFLKPFSGIVLT